MEFAPYGRVPHGKTRKDARQGTIDQDPEFIDFLESLTNPMVKPTPLESAPEGEASKGEVVTVTPLIQFLRDKKANKGKEPVPIIKNSKHSRNDSKESKTTQVTDKKASPKSAKDSPSSPDKRSATAIKVEKAARDAVKILNKQAVTANKVPVALPATSSPASSSPAQPTPSAPAADKRRERGNVSVAARILQRDLGIGQGNRRRRDAPSAAAPAGSPNALKSAGQSESSNASSSSPLIIKSTTVPPASSSPPAPTSTSTVKSGSSPMGSQPPTGPAASRPLAKPATSPAVRSPQAPSPAKLASVLPTSTQAFLKHANPSQGVTEPLLQEAFASFGTVNKVEIDKKKGFAYVDFAEPDGLQKAIKASPVKVAQGQVVVLERKTGPSLQARNVRGGGTIGGGRGGGIPMGPRGGRGGSVRGRGGMARGVSNPPATTTASSAASPQPASSLPTPVNANTTATTAKDSEARAAAQNGPSELPGAEPPSIPSVQSAAPPPAE